MNKKQMDVLFSHKKNDWETPQWLYEYLNKIYNFTLDPCATIESAKCSTFFTKEDNGLNQSWANHTVFMNPPYGKEIGNWIKKAYNEHILHNITIVCLIPARTDTKYFHNYI